MQQTFLDIIYKIFYETAQKDFKDIRLLLSEKYSFPSIKFEPIIEIKIPIPKNTEYGIIYSGYLFKNSQEDLITAWSFFLATVYHLAAHVAVSNYSVYNNWIKDKTPRFAWKVIDFIEDDSVDRYLLSTNQDVWTNLSKIKNEYVKHSTLNNKQSKFIQNLGSKTIVSIKNQMSQVTLQQFDNTSNNHKIQWASELYKNRFMFSQDTPFYYEQNNLRSSLILKHNKMKIFPSGKFASTIKKLNFLYLEEKERMDNILHKLRKDIRGLNFDDVVLPNEDIFEYFKLKEKNKKILKKIR